MRGQLRLDITNNCNIRCIMCQTYNPFSASQTEFMDLKDFRCSTKGMLKDWNTIQIGNIAEPTIHPQFEEFIRYIRSQFSGKIHVVTNGKLLHRYAGLFNETRCLVQVSTDSLRKETHEYLREGSSFDALMKGLDLLDVDRAQVLLSFTMVRSNIDEYGDIVKFCTDRKYSMAVFPMILRVGHGALPYRLIWESLWFAKDKLRAWLQAFYGKDYGRIIMGAASGTCFLDLSSFTCEAHRLDLGVDCHGDATLCFKQPLPNLLRNRIDDVWDSSEAQQFRHEVDHGRKPCVECDYRQRCLAPSMSLLENHFSQQVCTVLTPEVRKAIAFDSDLPGEQQARAFFEAIRPHFKVVHLLEPQGQRHRAVFMDELPALVHPREMDKLLSHQDAMTVEGASPLKLQEALYLKTLESGTTPRLVLGSFHGYNIVHYMEWYYGCPISLGHLNLTLAADTQRPGLIRCRTAEDVKAIIEKLTGKPQESAAPAAPAPAADAAPQPPAQQTPAIAPPRPQEASLPPDFVPAPPPSLSWRIKNRLLSYPWFPKDSARATVRFLRRCRRNLQGYGRLRNPRRDATAAPLPPAPSQGRRVNQLPQRIVTHAGHDIVYYSTKYHAIPAGQAPTADTLRAAALDRRMIGNTVAEVQRELDLIDAVRQGRRTRALVLATAAAPRLEALLAANEAIDADILCPRGGPAQVAGRATSMLLNTAGGPSDSFEPAHVSPQLLAQLVAKKYDVVIVPHDDLKQFWNDGPLVRLTAQLSGRLLVASPDGGTKLYKGEDIHRLTYTKCYLAHALQYTGRLRGQQVLDVGCSDGLVCDLVLAEDPTHVTGVDVLDSIGCAFPHDRISYVQTDAHHMPLPDGAFDFVYSIATLEHCGDPAAALAEMLRVVRPGGVVYVQAGPLYYSPFGHHMFGYFDDYPWIHLRLTPEQIIAHARATGVAARVAANTGSDIAAYVHGMLHLGHINGKRIDEYGLREMMSSGKVQVLDFTPSFEGDNLLTPAIERQLAPLLRQDLIAHGFQLTMRKT